MDTLKEECGISDEDLSEALKEMGAYVDVTEDDLKKIYNIALNHAREKLAQKIAVGDIMTKRVVAAKRNSDIREVSALLSENKISGLPVVDDENHVLGVISEADILAVAGMERDHTFRDILRHLLGEPLPKRKRGETAGDAMSSPAVTTAPEADIREVARILEERRIKRLPVVDRENRLLGIISRGDIVRVMGEK
jgi:CBS-domain-containing membrane protein